jgi:glutamyl-Q tRNA(Asp) synthetase
MEDLDKPREVPGAADDILKTLQAFGFEWDGAVMYQSHRQQAYAAALQRLQEKGLVYPCGCSRKEIADSITGNAIQHGLDGLIYPGICREGLADGKTPRAWRIRTNQAVIDFDDAIQGRIRHNLATEIGDFVLKRADGLYAYQLAVVVDDAEQGITHVVRGADLLDSTSRQIYLQQMLGLPTPAYAHVPAATNRHGEKLSKQTLAPSLDKLNPQKSLWQALHFLGQEPPLALDRVSLDELWQWAKLQWQPARVPRTRFRETTEP